MSANNGTAETTALGQPAGPTTADHRYRDGHGRSPSCLPGARTLRLPRRHGRRTWMGAGTATGGHAG